MANLLLPSNTTRSTFTVGELRGKVRSQIGLLDTAFVTDDDVDGFLLDFQNCFARDEEWYRFNTFFETSGGVSYYDLPADCITLSVVQYDIWKLPHITLQELLVQFPLAFAGAYKGPLPWFYSIDGANRLLLFPQPTVASGVLVIYSALPPRPIQSPQGTDFYYWPPYCDTAALYYGCTRACMKDFSREGQRKLAAFQAMYEREYQRAAARVRARSEEDYPVFGRRSSGGRVNPFSPGFFPRTVPLP